MKMQRRSSALTLYFARRQVRRDVLPSIIGWQCDRCRVCVRDAHDTLGVTTTAGSLTVPTIVPVCARGVNRCELTIDSIVPSSNFTMRGTAGAAWCLVPYQYGAPLVAKGLGASLRVSGHLISHLVLDTMLRLQRIFVPVERINRVLIWNVGC